MGSRVYLDTAPIIYFLEKNPQWYEKIEVFLYKGIQEEFQFVTSVITNIEYLVVPTRNVNVLAINNYWDFLRSLDVQVLQINREIAEVAVKLRAKYAGIKTADAIQLAASLHVNCDIFLSNDKQLLQVKEVPAKLMEQL
jgi:predicted nucleic acid-binding protein